MVYCKIVLIALDAESSLTQLKSSVEADGSRNYRYQQTFRGIPVFGEHVIVREDAQGNVRSLFGRSVAGLAAELPNLKAKLDSAQALGLAKSAGLGKRAGALQVRNESSQQMIYLLLFLYFMAQPAFFFSKLVAYAIVGLIRFIQHFFILFPGTQ